MTKITPTIQMVLAKYPKIAAVERLRTGGRPGEKTVRNIMASVKRLCQIAGIALEEPVSIFTRKQLLRILDFASGEKLKPVTIWSYLNALQAIFARWARSYYADCHWQLPAIELPSCNKQFHRYMRPDSQILAQVKSWYQRLAARDDGREWACATLMLEFAMRNGDVERLRWSDFRERDGAMVLCYTPHKTALSSGRRVAWPVHPDIWARLCDYRDHGRHYHKKQAPQKAGGQTGAASGAVRQRGVRAAQRRIAHLKSSLSAPKPATSSGRFASTTYTKSSGPKWPPASAATTSAR